MPPEHLEGAFAGAPPDAPREVSQPIDPDAMAQRMREARARNLEVRGAEVGELKPFNPQPADQAPFDTTPNETEANAASALLTATREQRADAERIDQAKANVASSLTSAARAQRSQPTTHQPAASDSDSPSRGVPRPLPKDKQITGGFTNLASQEYYPINGFEMQKIVEGMVRRLMERIPDDLRFQMVLAYPRAEMNLTLTVKCFVEAMNFGITYVASHEKTPLEVAQERAEEVVFVVKEVRHEFDETGESAHPADWMREEAGLPIPAKQLVGTGARRMLVDVPTEVKSTKDMF